MSASTCFVPECLERAQSWSTCRAHRIEELHAVLVDETTQFSAEEYDRRRRQDQQLVRHVDALVCAPTAGPDIERRAYSWPEITLTPADEQVRAQALADAEWLARMGELEARGWTAEPLPTRRAAVVARSSWDSTGGSRYGRAVLDGAASEILALKPGNRNNEIARIAFTVGGFVGGGEIDRSAAEEILVQAAREVGGRDGSQMADTARRALRAGEGRPLGAPDRADPLRAPCIMAPRIEVPR